MIFAGNQIWDHCQICGKFVRINKPIFGSLHICLSEEEIREKQSKPSRQLPTKTQATDKAA